MRTLRRARKNRCPALACFLGLLSAVASARAQTPLSDEADRLFNDGRAQLARGDVALACDSFEKSYELRPRHGTLLNLAVCLEQRGDRVLAFERFQEALAAAISDGRADRQELANRHLTELRQRLGWLRFEMAGPQPSNISITCDERSVVSDEQLTPVEPGLHRIRVGADGLMPFETTVFATAGETALVRVPRLVVAATDVSEVTVAASKEARRARAVAPPPRRVTSHAERRTAARSSALWLSAAGGTALAVGGVLGVRALVDAREIRNVCPGARCSTDQQWETARRLELRATWEARTADIVLPLGALAVALGSYLFLRKPDDSHDHTRRASNNRSAMLTEWTW